MRKACPHKPISMDGRVGRSSSTRRASRHQCDIQFALIQHPRHRAACATRHADLHQRIGRCIAGENRGKERNCIFVRHSQPHSASLRQGIESHYRLFGDSKSAPRVGQKRFTCWRQHYRAPLMHKDRLSDLRFKPFHLHADGRWRPVHCSGSTDEAACVDNRHQSTQERVVQPQQNARIRPKACVVRHEWQAPIRQFR